MKKIFMIVFMLLSIFTIVGWGSTIETKSSTDNEMSQKAETEIEIANISQGDLRKIVFALVSSAENSDIHYDEQYAYIEDIDDGRGYTAGIIGFTSGTGDLLDVVRQYTKLKPDNDLKQFIPALEAVNGTDSHEGLGVAFESAWRAAAEDEEMIQAQSDILDEQYMDVAIQYAACDGLSPLGQYIYYDALVVHGSGDSNDCFEAIRDAALGEIDPPSAGGDEALYLSAFLSARIPVMELEEAHTDLSRLETQKKFLDEGNFLLNLPLQWTMYGDQFELKQEDIDEMR